MGSHKGAGRFQSEQGVRLALGGRALAARAKDPWTPNMVINLTIRVRETIKFR